MPRRFWNVFIIILFSASLFGLTSWAESSATIRATASVMPAIGFDNPSDLVPRIPGSVDLAPYIRYAENIGIICHISTGSVRMPAITLCKPGEQTGSRHFRYFFPGPLVSLCDISPQLNELISAGDTCQVTIIYSEN